MGSDRINLAARARAYWRPRWSVPKPLRPYVHDLLAAYVLFAVFTVWLILSLFSAYGRWVRAIGAVLPEWFPFASLFLAPVFLALAGAPFIPRASWRIVPALLGIVCVEGMNLLYNPHAPAEHQAAEFTGMAVLGVEALVIIPWWNRWYRRRDVRRRREAGEAIPDFEPARAEVKRRKSGLRDYLLYVAIALGLASVVVAYVLNR